MVLPHALKFFALLFILSPSLLSTAVAAFIRPPDDIPHEVPDPVTPRPVPIPVSGSEPGSGSGFVGSDFIAHDATNPPFSEPKLENNDEEDVMEKVADLIKELAESIVDLLDSPASSTSTSTITSIYPPSVTLPARATIDQNMASQGCSIYSFYEAECATPTTIDPVDPATLRASCLCYTPLFALPSSSSASATPTPTAFAYAPNIFDNAARACAAYTSDGTAAAPTISAWPSEPPAESAVGFCASVGDVREVATTAAAATSTGASAPGPTSSGSAGSQNGLMVGMAAVVVAVAVAVG